MFTERDLYQYLRSPAIRDKIGLPRTDAGETMALTRELLHKLSTIAEKKYDNLKGRQFVPVSHEIPNGAETWGYDVYDRNGVAKVTSNYEGRGPRVDTKVNEVTGRITGVRAGYGWSFQDLRNAAMSGRPLQTRRAEAARLAIEEAIDANIAIGVPGSGFTGLINNADVSAAAISGVTGNWVAGGATAMQMAADLDKIAIEGIIVPTRENETPDSVLLPPSQYYYLATTRVDPVNPETALQMFLRTSEWCRFVGSWNKLTTAGDSSGTRTVVYKRDPMILEAHIPQEFEQFPPQAEGAEMLVECHARIAGVAVRYPGAVRYQDGL